MGIFQRPSYSLQETSKDHLYFNRYFLSKDTILDGDWFGHSRVSSQAFLDFYVKQAGFPGFARDRDKICCSCVYLLEFAINITMDILTQKSYNNSKPLILRMPVPRDSIFQHLLEPEGGPEGGITNHQKSVFRGLL